MKQRVDEPYVESTALERMIDFESLKLAKLQVEAMVGYDPYSEALQRCKERNDERIISESKIDSGLTSTLFQRLSSAMSTREGILEPETA